MVGRTRADVVRLLGEPEVPVDGGTSTYLLCPSFIDIYILEIDWANGRVASTRVRDT